MDCDERREHHVQLRHALLTGIGWALVVGLALSAARQVPVWRSDVSVWTQAVAVNPQSPIALLNLGAARDDDGLERLALAVVEDARFPQRTRDQVRWVVAVNQIHRLLRNGDRTSASFYARRLLLHTSSPLAYGACVRASCLSR